MKLRGNEIDPPAITTTWEEEVERRVLAHQLRHGAVEHGGLTIVRQAGGGVPAAILRGAKVLGVAVLAYRPGAIGRVTVQCPHCGGRRNTASSNFRSWEQAGQVPPCETRPTYPRCERETAEGVPDAD